MDLSDEVKARAALLEKQWEIVERKAKADQAERERILKDVRDKRAENVRIAKQKAAEAARIAREKQQAEENEFTAAVGLIAIGVTDVRISDLEAAFEDLTARQETERQEAADQRRHAKAAVDRAKREQREAEAAYQRLWEGFRIEREGLVADEITLPWALVHYASHVPVEGKGPVKVIAFEHDGTLGTATECVDGIRIQTQNAAFFVPWEIIEEGNRIAVKNSWFSLAGCGPTKVRDSKSGATVDYGDLFDDQ